MSALQDRLSAILNEANGFYHQAGKVGLAPVLKYDYYQRSIKRYNEALDYAQNHEQRASIFRNIGVASSKACKALPAKEEINMKLYHLQQAAKHLTLAFDDGVKTAKPEEWTEKVYELLTESLDDMVVVASNMELNARITNLKILEEVISNYDVKAELFFRMTYILFNAAVSAQGKGDWLQSLNMLHNCAQYVDTGLKYARRKWVTEDLKDLGVRRYIHICIAESTKCRIAADQVLANHLVSSENVNIDLMWEVVDMYKQAALLTRENDMEEEAIAISRQGRMFDKIFTVKEKAHAYRQALDMGLALHPRDLSNCDWFKECKEAIQRFQQAAAAEAERLRALDRQTYLDQLKDELDALAAAAQSTPTDFIEHIYSKHPPKDPGHVIPPELKSPDREMKKILLKVFVHYHPDKQGVHNAGRKWEVLCEEITKHLNKIYLRYK